MRIAALQFAPRRARPDANLARMRELVRSVEADLIVLPELAASGYFFTSPEEARSCGERPGAGPSTAWMLETASRKNAVVIGGFLEDDGRNLYNAALIATPNGAAHVYRKTHLFYREREVFAPGDTGFFVVEWGGVRIGTMICYDWRFPEASRSLALLGADVIAHPSNLVAAADVWGPTMSTRALENKVIVVTANRHGSEQHDGETLTFTGRSRVWGQNGATLAEAPPDANDVIVAEVDPEATRHKAFNAVNDLFADRRPEMYLPMGTSKPGVE